MKRRQAKKCVERHFSRPMTIYPWPTWARVLRTMVRHRLVFYSRGHWGTLPPESRGDRP